MITMALTTISLLEVWERGAGRTPLDRSLLLLEKAGSAEPEALPVGERERRLWALRRALYGRHLDAVAECPACGERLEFELDAEAICPAGTEPAAAETLRWREGDWDLAFHLPTSRELSSLAVAADGIGPEERLRACLIEGVTRNERPVPAEALPAPVIERWERHLSAIDPLAETLLRLQCAACDHRWSEVFDIGGYLWRELSEEAERLFGEVHRLASAYGWSERDILALSPRRRRAYLERIEA